MFPPDAGMNIKSLVKLEKHFDKKVNLAKELWMDVWDLMAKMRGKFCDLDTSENQKSSAFGSSLSTSWFSKPL